MKSQQKPTKSPKAKAGRPKAQIDWVRVDKLLIAGCEGVGIADIIGVHPTTLYLATKARYKMDFTVYRQQKVANGNELIRTKQFALAIEGDKTMLIWLGKQRLNQSEKVKTELSGNITTNLDDSRLIEIMEQTRTTNE